MFSLVEIAITIVARQYLLSNLAVLHTVELVDSEHLGNRKKFSIEAYRHLGSLMHYN